MPTDPVDIVPPGVPPQLARVTPLTFAVRTIAEYDAAYLRDRLRSDLFIDGKPTGTYSVLALDDRDPIDLPEAIEFFGPRLEENVIREFVGNDYKQKVEILETELKALRDFVERDRWYQFQPVRRYFRNLRLRAKAARTAFWGRD